MRLADHPSNNLIHAKPSWTSYREGHRILLSSTENTRLTNEGVLLYHSQNKEMPAETAKAIDPALVRTQ
jgi:hypothetical protein